MRNKISGVYKITNTITGDFYIGSSNDIKSRWTSHKKPSVWARYSNSKMYQDMQKYGRDNFKFEVIEETNNLREREQYWFEQLKPSYNNIRAIGQDIERYRQSHKDYNKEYYEIHRDVELDRKKKYNETHQDELRIYQNTYYSRLCSYEGETLTLRALMKRFRRLGIPQPTQEAKKYLLEED